MPARHQRFETNGSAPDIVAPEAEWAALITGINGPDGVTCTVSNGDDVHPFAPAADGVGPTDDSGHYKRLLVDRRYLHVGVNV